MTADETNSRKQHSSVSLIRAGLKHLDQARRGIALLEELGMDIAGRNSLLQALVSACDPDKALDALVHLTEPRANANPQIVSEGNKNTESNSLRNGYTIRELTENIPAFSALMQVLGASQAMGRLMNSRPDLVSAALEAGKSHQNNCLQDKYDFLLADADTNQAEETEFNYAASVNMLRAEYYKRLCQIMVQDLSSKDPVAEQPTISKHITWLAERTIQGALQIARKRVSNSGECRFAIIGMGKLGACELNYVSDVDLVYVVEPSPGRETMSRDELVEIGSRIAVTLQQVCQSVIPAVSEPPLWKVDTALRPEGKDGPLVRTLSSFEEYYESWAKNWEFQALLKARFIAGDDSLGKSFQEMCDRLVWAASQRNNFVYDCQQMRSRVERLIPSKLKNREIKLGEGGLRDVEFTVQMLQLVHGRTDSSLRTRSTLDALSALAAGGYIAVHHAERLAEDYKFERVLEHRQQMWLLKRTHLFPDLGVNNNGGLNRRRALTLKDFDNNEDLYRLARAFRLHPDKLVERYDQTRREIRTLHLAIFFRPMLPIEARLDDDEVSLQPQAARERFASIGFADPDAALRHVQALTHGLSRSAKINRILLPAVFSWLGNGQDPDMGLLGWRTLEERFGNKTTYLAFLRDSTSAAQRLCHILSNSRFLGTALCKSVESVTWLGDDNKLKPRTLNSLEVTCRGYFERHVDNIVDFSNALRAMRRREIERIGLGWLSGICSDDDCLIGMSDVLDSIIGSALEWSMRAQAKEESLKVFPVRITIIALGRYGGREANFNSDADIMIVYEPTDSAGEQEAASFALAVCNKVRTILGSMTVSTEPKIDLDLDLRPEGRSGSIVRSLESCRAYYEKWASSWEHQALLRARYAAGDFTLSQRFLHEIADPLRYPLKPLNGDQVAEIRKLKARMEAERLPRGVQRDRHLKLGSGGLSDVEWTVQLLQLQHAGHCPELRVVSTIAALKELKQGEFLNAYDAEALETCWKLCTNARNGRYLWSGRPSQADILPDDNYILGAMAVYLGYPAHRGAEFANEILCSMRRSREVMNRLFYGEHNGIT